MDVKTCCCIHSVYCGHQEASSIISQQKKRKKIFAPGPPRGPPSIWPTVPKSDALPFCHGDGSEIGQKLELFIILHRQKGSTNIVLFEILCRICNFQTKKPVVLKSLTEDIFQFSLKIRELLNNKNILPSFHRTITTTSFQMDVVSK